VINLSQENQHKPEHPHGQPPKGKPEGPPNPPGKGGGNKPPKVDDRRFA
jgi:hypothetical protein